MSVDGDQIRRRREALGLSRPAIAAEPGSPSESVWEVAEGVRRQISSRSATRINSTLDRLERERERETVQVRTADLAMLFDELAALRRAVEALEADRGQP